MDQVATELQELAQQVRECTTWIPSLTLVSGYSLDSEGYLVLGPQATCHALTTVHHTAARHLQQRKLLAKFWERFVAEDKQRLAKEVY